MVLSLMTCRAVPVLEWTMQDLVQQPLVFRGVRLMTADAIRVGYRDSTVRIRHACNLEIMTTFAQPGPLGREQAFNICVVRNMAFQAVPFLCGTVLMFAFFNMNRQICMT